MINWLIVVVVGIGDMWKEGVIFSQKLRGKKTDPKERGVAGGDPACGGERQAEQEKVIPTTKE